MIITPAPEAADGISQYKDIIVALIAVFGVLFGGVIPYLFQRNKELNLKIADQKREAYAGFLKNFTETSAAAAYDEKLTGKEFDLERMYARDKLLLYGSDEVIRAFHEWVEYTGKDMNHESDLTNDVFLAIRKDILGRTKLRPGEIANLNPFNRG